jgi:hypothetical protein
MKAVFLTGHGGNEVVAVGERPMPRRRPGDVLVVCTGFPSRQARNAFARRSCSNNNLKRDDDSSESHHALGDPIPARPNDRLGRGG